MSWIEEDFVPDPKRTTVYRGAVFNPWVNIPLCVLLTLGAGAATVWLAGLFVELGDKPEYPDQGLDIVGALIGLIVGAITTVVLLIVTIFTIRWWIRNAREFREQQRHPRPSQSDLPNNSNGPGWQQYPYENGDGNFR